jgi:putative membrane protein
VIVSAACVAAVVAYGLAARHPGGRGSRSAPLRFVAFTAGIGVLWLALGPVLDPLAHLKFSLHMLQHVLLTLVAPPLILLGTPLVVVRRAAAPPLRRALGAAGRTPLARVLLFPPVTWAAFPAALWVSHYTPLYEAALEHPAVHVLEHVLYLGTALLFWFPVVGAEPGPWRLPYGLRLLYLFLAVPQNAFLGLSLYQAGRVLYPNYEIVARAARIDPLADQQNGALVMWLLGALLFFAALLILAAAWAREDRLAGRWADRRFAEDAKGEVRDGIEAEGVVGVPR